MDSTLLHPARFRLVIGLLAAVGLVGPSVALGQDGLDVFATKLFETESGDERKALAFDDATQLLYTGSASNELRAYTLDGTLVRGPLSLTSGGQPLPGRPGEIGLEMLREATSIASDAIPAGTLVLIQAGTTADDNETTLYALDETTGATTTSDALVTGLTPPPPSCPNSDALKDRAASLAYSTQRDLFLSVDINCNLVAEIDDGNVTSYFVVPGGIAGTSGGAGVAVHPVTGHIWLGGAILGGSNRLAEFTEDGVLLRQLNIRDAANGDPVFLRRLVFDASGERLFMVTFGAAVYALGAPPPVPGLSVGGLGIALFLMMLSALALRRTA